MSTGPEPIPPDSRRGGWHQRYFAAAMEAEQRRRRPDYDAHKRALLGDLRGDVLEIGPGTGPNLAYYPLGVRWLGLEPNPAMFPYLRREAQRLGMTIRLREGRTEQIDATDGSFDAVVGTLVLCSVSDPHRTLREILRVLKPGGRFVFIEHVAAPPGSGLRRLQRFLRPVWRAVSDGCHTDRETGAMIEGAGFRRVEIGSFRLDVPVVGQHIAGYAER